MKDNLLQIAAKKGRTVWLRQLLQEHLPELSHADADYHDWFNSLLKVMNERGLVEPTQQKDYLSDVRNAIKVLDPQHPALEIVDFDKATWTEINNHYSDRIAERTTKFIDNPDAIVKRATTLLKSYQWSEIACGLAVVTGRRCTEVIKTARFEYKSKYSVIFTGALKRGDERVECVFEIPTLCQAQLVINAIGSLRTQLGEEINHLSKRQVSSRYSRGVAKISDRYFADLVPPREDKDNLYTHLFRAVYATIASYWYCPPTVPEIEFRAAIQGHYQILDEKDPKLRRSIAAGRHYFDYKISNGAGNIDGRLGIKLHLPDVEVIEEFRIANLNQKDDLKTDRKHKSVSPTQPLTALDGQEKSSIQSDRIQSKKPRAKIMTDQSPHNNANSIAIPSFFFSRLEAIAAKLEISPDQTIQALFTWTEMGLSLADNLDVEKLNPQAVFESVEELSKLARQQSVSGKRNSPQQLLFEPEDINQICTSVRLLAEAVSRQQKNIRHKRFVRSVIEKNRPYDDSHDADDTFPRSEHQPRASNRAIEAEDVINLAIDSIIEYNNAEDIATPDKWYIGVGSLRKLTQKGDSVINRVIEKRKEEIESHNSLHGLGKWHNARGKDYPSIDECIPFVAAL